MAANLTQYVTDCTGVMVVQGETNLWSDIGTANFTEYGPLQVALEAELQGGSLFNFELAITGDSTCVLITNGQPFDTTYTTNDDNGGNGQIVIVMPPGTLAIYQWNGGTRLDPSGGPDLWMGPESALQRRKRK